MKRVAIFSKTICPGSISIIRHLQANNYPIEMVIVEKNVRKKFSQPEKKFRAAHDQFNRKFKKYGLTRRIVRRLWDIFIPIQLKRAIEQHVASIPVVNKASTEVQARKANIPVKTVKRHSSKETRKLLIENKIDIVLFGSSNWLLKEDVLSIENCRIINVHPGKLPDFKGLDALQWTLVKGGQIGCTAFCIDESIDGGDTLKFCEVPPQAEDTTAKLQRRISSKKPEILLEVLHGLNDGSIVPKKQLEGGFMCYPMTYDELLTAEEKLQSLLKN